MHFTLESQPINVWGLLECDFVYIVIINPRRACAERVTVLGSCVCVCVCVCVCLFAPFRPLRVKVNPENDTNASTRQDKENETGDFLKNAPFKS